MSANKQAKLQDELITLVNPKAPISEAYRLLRTNVQFSMVDETVQTLMITSAGPGEGKSTTVANLAVTYAQADYKVLLVDCDLRKPVIHQFFSLSNRSGLTTLLSSRMYLEQWEEELQATTLANLQVMTSGPVPPNPAEILGSKRMWELVEEWKKHYDIVLFDVPPALVVTDAQLIGSRCDGTLLVIRAGKVKKEQALKAKQSLEHVQARVLGTILNNVERKKKDAGYYYYYGT